MMSSLMEQGMQLGRLWRGYKKKWGPNGTTQEQTARTA